MTLGDFKARHIAKTTMQLLSGWEWLKLINVFIQNERNIKRTAGGA